MHSLASQIGGTFFRDYNPDLSQVSPTIISEDGANSKKIEENRDRKWHAAVSRAQDRHCQRIHAMFVQRFGNSFNCRV
jgi:hypothetical protein